jgi:hypothetical protein
MKKIVCLMLVVVPLILTVVAVDESRAETRVNGGYDPKASYQGIYEKDRVYAKRHGADLWVGSAKPAKIYSVKCSSAAQSLGSGIWIGNLNTNGTCGPAAEPTEWAMGNYLNFMAGPGQPE